MGLFDRFPWVNTHELNLDWIIQKMKEWGIQATENVQKATQAAQTAGQDALAAKNSAAVAQEAASMAKDAAEGAEARAQDSATNAANAETAATNAETAATNAETAAENSSLNATAARNAAESALAAAAQSWPYIYSDNYGVYRLSPVIDQVTNTNKIYMMPPAAPNLSIYAVDYPLCQNKSGQQVHPYCVNVHISGTESVFSEDLESIFLKFANPEILGVFVKRFKVGGVSTAPGSTTPALNVQIAEDEILTASVMPSSNHQKDILIQIFIKGGAVG